MTQDMLATHPLEVPEAEALSAVIAVLNECAAACTMCADACLSEVMVTHMRTCIRLDQDCADICTATARVLSRQNGREEAAISELLAACAAACAACALECEDHGSMHEHCRICAEVCRRCERACLDLLASREASRSTDGA